MAGDPGEDGDVSETNIPSVDDRMRALLAEMDARNGWGPHDLYAMLWELAKILNATRNDAAVNAALLRELRGEVNRHSKRLIDLTDIVSPDRDDLPSRTWSRTDPTGSMPGRLTKNAFGKIGVKVGPTTQADLDATCDHADLAERDLRKALATLGEERVELGRARGRIRELEESAVSSRLSYDRANADLIDERHEHGATRMLFADCRSDLDAARIRADVAEAAVEGLGKESELLTAKLDASQLTTERLTSELRDARDGVQFGINALSHWFRELSVAIGLGPNTDHGKSASWESLIEAAAGDYQKCKALKERPFEVLHGLGYRIDDGNTLVINARPAPLPAVPVCTEIVPLTAEERDLLEIPAAASDRMWWRSGDDIHYGLMSSPLPFHVGGDTGSIRLRAYEIIKRQRSVITAASAERTSEYAKLLLGMDKICADILRRIPNEAGRASRKRLIDQLAEYNDKREELLNFRTGVSERDVLEDSVRRWIEVYELDRDGLG